MNLKEKLGTFHKLLDDGFLEADYALLKKEDPKNTILTKPCNQVQGREALLELVELVGEKAIIKHRKSFHKEQKKEAEIARKAEQLSQKEALLEQLEEGKLKEVRDAVDHLPEDHLFLGDLVEVLEEAEAVAAEKVKGEAGEQKEEILKLLEEGKITEAEEAFVELPKDFIFLTELAEAINDARVAATEAEEKAAAEKAVEEAEAENNTILRLLEDSKLEEAETAIVGLPEDHPFKANLVEALEASKEDAPEKSNEEDTKQGAGNAAPAAGEPGDDPAKKKEEDTQGASSKKNKSTQGSGGTS